MHALLDLLNGGVDRFTTFALPMLLQSSLLIAVLAALDWVWRHRVRAALRSAIWLLVPVKLLLPPSLSLPTGIGYWLGQPHRSPAPLPVATSSPVAVAVDTVRLPEPASSSAPAAPAPAPRRLSAATWLFLVWGTVVLG